jgi:hypothetical protein
MSTKQSVPISDEALEEATLAGIPCRAMAWVRTTQLTVIDGRKGHRVVDGVRTWHGQAVVESEGPPPRWEYNAAVRYEGLVRKGDDLYEVSADVYIHQRFHRAPERSEYDAGDRPPRHYFQVRFTGAGNLPLG